MTPPDKHHIVNHAKKHPNSTRQQIKNDLNLNISLSIISNTLKENGLTYHVVRKKPLISAKNRKARMKFAKEYIQKPPSFWTKILFTDESRFSGKSDGRK